MLPLAQGFGTLVYNEMNRADTVVALNLVDRQWMWASRPYTVQCTYGGNGHTFV